MELFVQHTFGTADPNGQLAGTSSASIAQKTALECSKHSMFNARPVNPNFASIRCARHTQTERTTAYVIA